MSVSLVLWLLAASGPGSEGNSGVSLRVQPDFPAVLTAPDEAQHEASLSAMSAGARAELSLLAGDGQRALEHVGQAGEAEGAETLPAPRRLRLMADARILLGHTTEAAALLTELNRYEGWGRHVTRQRLAMKAIGRVRATARTGLALYALALGALALGGARELLRLHAAAMFMLALSLTALAVARATWTPLGLAAGIAGLSATFIVHAGAATLSRLEPGPRGRLLVVSIVVLGAVGAWAALAAELARAFWSS